jgi:hypothetical protein
MNYPDDWNCYYETCSSCGGSFHASEGGCDNENCYEEEGDREWLLDSGYVFDGTFYVKVVSRTKRQARKDHQGVTIFDNKTLIKKGESYWDIRTICICNETGRREFGQMKKKIYSD